MDYQTKGSLLVGLACSKAYFGRTKAIFDFMTVHGDFASKTFARPKKMTVLQVMVGRVIITRLQLTSWLSCGVKSVKRCCQVLH